MRERDVTIDLSALPACPRCGARPALVRRHDIAHLTWKHEHDCPVPDLPDERAALTANVALAVAWHRGGFDA
jgi:hypothetical protein